MKGFFFFHIQFNVSFISDLCGGVFLFLTYRDLADYFFSFFLEILPNENKGVLNLVWTTYTSTLAVAGCPEHVLKVYHHHLPDLPWKEFVPDMADLDLMIQVDYIIT